MTLSGFLRSPGPGRGLAAPAVAHGGSVRRGAERRFSQRPSSPFPPFGADARPAFPDPVAGPGIAGAAPPDDAAVRPSPAGIAEPDLTADRGTSPEDGRLAIGAGTAAARAASGGRIEEDETRTVTLSAPAGGAGALAPLPGTHAAIGPGVGIARRGATFRFTGDDRPRPDRTEAAGAARTLRFAPGAADGGGRGDHER